MQWDLRKSHILEQQERIQSIKTRVQLEQDLTWTIKKLLQTQKIDTLQSPKAQTPFVMRKPESYPFQQTSLHYNKRVYVVTQLDMLFSHQFHAYSLGEKVIQENQQTYRKM